MPYYAIRRIGTENYFADNGEYGPLDDAYLYDDLADAQRAAYPQNEVVEVALTVHCVVPLPETP